MNSTRRDILKLGGVLAASTALASTLPRTARAAETPNFDINQSFEDFMRGIGGSATDGGGDVKFIGQDPLLRSHFRIGSSMAIPAMAAAVGAAAIWKERTGEGQDVQVDLRESIYNVNPIIALVLNHEQSVGLIPADDPIPRSLTFVPGINGGWYQAPWGIGNPFSFQIFRTKDGKFVTITGAYPHLYDRALELLRVPPDRDAITKAIAQWDSAELDEAMAEARVIGGVHRTAEEWLVIRKDNISRKRPSSTFRRSATPIRRHYTSDPDAALVGHQVPRAHPCHRGVVRGKNAGGIRRRGSAYRARPVVRAPGDMDRRQCRHALDRS